MKPVVYRIIYLPFSLSETVISLKCHSICFPSVDLFIHCGWLENRSFCPQNLQAQKTDNQQIKVKLRRLEEDNAKREKQIEELLDPTRVRSHCQCVERRVERRNHLFTPVFLSRHPSTLVVWWIRKRKAAW